ncbi:hypothetical protein NEUTE1DRAFT_142844 [Neurospora tetrasperma FGSC 2508]|uniref:Uncharacterized protein n=1 Tax=Neurospora tetrasperma (strain FGSC 2508 / ATCC MYA-4615 / P0657) TaxID=510951 RepID=F8N0S8_NEUT8|nr:uncharacterized protein NEUTE1DRAFT_142844 [Neurospora tetrasperma FGSC 2508]EGO53014.1 hypothetical protein NEUTE1DRAFT_142844 [Neurospora tetrasperma FGSC 2508]
MPQMIHVTAVETAIKPCLSHPVLPESRQHGISKQLSGIFETTGQCIFAVAYGKSIRQALNNQHCTMERVLIIGTRSVLPLGVVHEIHARTGKASAD